MDPWEGARGQAYRTGTEPGDPFRQGDRHTEQGWTHGRGPGVRDAEQGQIPWSCPGVRYRARTDPEERSGIQSRHGSSEGVQGSGIQSRHGSREGFQGSVVKTGSPNFRELQIP